MFGPEAIWGDWRNAPNMTNEILNILENTQTKVTDRLLKYAKSSERFG